MDNVKFDMGYGIEVASLHCKNVDLTLRMKK